MKVIVEIENEEELKKLEVISKHKEYESVEIKSREKK
jgi:hypothetical protein